MKSLHEIIDDLYDTIIDEGTVDEDVISIGVDTLYDIISTTLESILYSPTYSEGLATLSDDWN